MDRCSTATHRHRHHMHVHTHTHTLTHTHGETFTRSADRSISSRLRAGESLAMVLSVCAGLKMEASSTTIDREVQSGADEHTQSLL